MDIQLVHRTIANYFLMLLVKQILRYTIFLKCVTYMLFGDCLRGHAKADNAKKMNKWERYKLHSLFKKNT